MKTILTRVAAFLSVVLLSACATRLEHSNGCVGTVMSPPPGLVEIADDELLRSALGAPAKGALCAGKVFIAEKEVTVYRVWDSAKSYTLYGRWWSFSAPTGPRDKYQVDNDICPEWSPLNTVSSCTVKIGAKIVVGPGQSAQCAERLLPASAVNQVYIANDSRNNALFVDHCSKGTDWPEPAAAEPPK